MDDFPLYNTLSKNLPKKDLSLKQKKDFITKIEDINTQGSELIYALIRAYQILNQGDTPNEKLPFEGQIINENNLEFNISKIPIELRQILYKFLCLHIKSIQEQLIHTIH
jgi:hypothetical protein